MIVKYCHQLKNRLDIFLKQASRLGEPDRWLLIISGLIIVFGLIMLSSASSVVAYNNFQDSYYFFKHQLFYLIIGLIFYWLLSNFDYHRLRKVSLIALIISIVLLILVFIPGLSKTVNGSRSWINLFGFTMQPAEFVKLSLLIYLAAWFESKKQQEFTADQKVVPFLVVYGLVAILMLLQPDLGTLIIVTVATFAVWFINGARLKHLLFMALAGLAVLAVMISFKEYQRNRFHCVIDPSFSASDACFQVNQSLIAIGSGGFWGRGLGLSRQKYLYLPEVQNDFIFAIIAEEAGYLFGAGLIILFLSLFYRGYLIAKRSSDEFGRNLAIGIVVWLTFQAMINIGGIINLLPMTGVPLPLVSAGGTAIIAALMALGVLSNISRQVKRY